MTADMDWIPSGGMWLWEPDGGRCLAKVENRIGGGSWGWTGSGEWFWWLQETSAKGRCDTMVEAQQAAVSAWGAELARRAGR